MATAQDEFNELMRSKEKRSGHPEDDNSDARSFLNLSEDEDATPPASHAASDDDEPRSSLSQARHTIPLTRYNANTGPKGVISDAQHFRDSRRQHRDSIRSPSTLATHVQNGLSLDDQVHAEKRAAEEAGRENNGGEEDEGLDDNFMKRWRDSRLRELQHRGGHNAPRMHNRMPSRRMWGSLTAVDGEGYLDAVDKSPADTVVIVYIYDEYSEVSCLIEEHIRVLARRRPETRFVKMHYLDAEMEPAGVPALLAYRGGEKFAGLVPVIDEVPDEAEVDDVTLENLLRR
ncbi:hypothetical protein LTR62_000317 [Meristemomyces frigidus]|uniref:Phosducin domain-containing protein n=1 Tax=Meristemomyces frigidus TaxID=1508187 RepID=A0AAN7TXT4_9PEZI|nr:hypothetical protein LTR62_000317 [Meristemomyces frigidus]